MKKGTKIAIILGICLMVAGICLSAVSLIALDFDFDALATAEFTQTTHELDAQIRNIHIFTDTADVRLVYTPDQPCAVVFLEEGAQKHRVSLENGSLHITEVDPGFDWSLLKINFHSPRITVYLPLTEYGSITVKTDTGDVSIPAEFSFTHAGIETDTGDITWKASSRQLEMATDTGDISLHDGDCDILTVETDTGDVAFHSFSAQQIDVETDTGDVSFHSFSAQQIDVETDTGDVEGSLRSQMVFFVKTDTGDVDVPKTVTGGKCCIETNTGDVELEIE